MSRRKLTELQAQQIRELRLRGMSYGRIALKFGIDKPRAYRIANGYTYKSGNNEKSTTPAITA